ncbi:MAG: hypothetical protein QOE63_663, partial [Acidimicrobiaceae bacterium]
VLAPVIDRLAIVLDGMSSVHTNLEQLAGAVGALRTDRNESARAQADTTARLLAVHEVLETSHTDSERTRALLDRLGRALDGDDDDAAASSPLGDLDERLNEILAAVAMAIERADRANQNESQHASALSGRLDRLGEEVAALSSRAAQPVAQPADPYDHGDANTALQQRLDRLHADVRTLGQAVGAIPTEPSARPSEDLGGASAALVASAAAAMARLEGRIESEFDSVSRQSEALGTLVNQAIEAIERVERELHDVQPVTEKMRNAANRTLDALRSGNRRRPGGGPPQLGR